VHGLDAAVCAHGGYRVIEAHQTDPPAGIAAPQNRAERRRHSADALLHLEAQPCEHLGEMARALVLLMA
jgi:hypothetical protein